MYVSDASFHRYIDRYRHLKLFQQVLWAVYKTFIIKTPFENSHATILNIFITKVRDPIIFYYNTFLFSV